MKQETNEIKKTADELVEDKIMMYKKKKNIELYKPYKIFSYDLIFYYAIIYLFLTMEKGLSPAQVLEFDAFYIFFRLIVQIPVTILICRIGKNTSSDLRTSLSFHCSFCLWGFLPDFSLHR